MIFITVGTQLPFDRLITAMDTWSACHSDSANFAQIGQGGFEPSYMNWSYDLEPGEFHKYLEDCDIVIAHAGIGTIISAIEMGKRVIVMPRRASFGEHRSDHQLATVSRLKHLPGLEVALDTIELQVALSRPPPRSAQLCQLTANSELVRSVRHFVGLDAT